MSTLNRVLQVFLAGAVASLATALLILLCSVSGLFALLGVPVDNSAAGIAWYLGRMLFGGLWALLFLVPLMSAKEQWVRGLVVAIGPIAYFWFFAWPMEGRGILGLASGPLLPLSALFFWALWGVMAGLWLDRVTKNDGAGAV